MGEILELTWRGVDLMRRTVTVFRSKNGERGTIPVNQAVPTVLKIKVKVKVEIFDLCLAESKEVAQSAG